MNKAQIAVLLTAAVAVGCVNLLAVIPYFHKGVQHPVGSDAVSVYLPRADSSVPTVPIMQTPTNSNEAFTDTGQRVTVYLRNSYHEAEMRRYPKMTLSLFLVFGIIYFIASRAGSNKLTQRQ